jgi:5-methylcytosine-specific restriction protein A
LCRSCKARGIIRIATHVDHILPIAPMGDADPYDESNYQSLCLVCHTDKTNMDMGNVVKNVFGSDGFPINTNHHWNNGKGGGGEPPC